MKLMLDATIFTDRRLHDNWPDVILLHINRNEQILIDFFCIGKMYEIVAVENEKGNKTWKSNSEKYCNTVYTFYVCRNQNYFLEPFCYTRRLVDTWHDYRCAGGITASNSPCDVSLIWRYDLIHHHHHHQLLPAEKSKSWR